MGTWVIEVKHSIFDVRSDLRGCLEATMASEVTKAALRDIQQIYTKIIKVTPLKSESNLNFKAIEAV